MDYMAFTHVTIAGCDVILCRTGYTGEHGYELVPAWDDAATVWDALVDALKPFDGVICGLGARDTLRTEMGYPLHGHELSLEITPVQAGSNWAVGWKKENFRGAPALRSEKEAGPKRVLRGLQSTDRGIPRAGMDVKNSAGEIVGVVTSGTFSPSLKKGIALALVKPEYTVGDSLVIDVRGRESIAEIVTLPMVASHVR
jgi:aminomethyltransferase